MCQLIYGKTTICGNDYPFCFNGESFKITIYFGSKAIEVPDGLDRIIGQKFGPILGGNILYILSVPLSSPHTFIDENGPKNRFIFNHTSSVKYFIEDYQMDYKYTEMRLQFPELNYFIPSVGISTVSSEEAKVSRVKETICSFDIQYRNTTILISFDATMSCTVNNKCTIETLSEVSLKFAETDDLDYLTRLYSSIRQFFVFICNRQNIGLRSAKFIGIFSNKKLDNKTIVDANGYTIQKFVFSQKYLEPIEEIKYVEQTPNSRLFSSNLKEFVQLFFEDSPKDLPVVSGRSIHRSAKYRNLINLEHSLQITSTFEYYVRSMLPEISSQETISFFNDIESLVEDYINKSCRKIKKKAKSFIKSLKPQVSLEEKILRTFNGYSNWLPLKSILSDWFGKDIKELAKVANLWRNELAHERREYEPDINVIRAVRLMEHINYCIVLRHARYSDEQIKTILNETLIR